MSISQHFQHILIIYLLYFISLVAQNCRAPCCLSCIRRNRLTINLNYCFRNITQGSCSFQTQLPFSYLYIFLEKADGSIPVLPRGYRQFPFHFILPESCLPCSFESKIGTIRYYVKVSIVLLYGVILHAHDFPA